MNENPDQESETGSQDQSSEAPKPGESQGQKPTGQCGQGGNGRRLQNQVSSDEEEQARSTHEGWQPPRRAPIQISHRSSPGARARRHRPAP